MHCYELANLARTGIVMVTWLVYYNMDSSGVTSLPALTYGLNGKQQKCEQFSSRMHGLNIMAVVLHQPCLIESTVYVQQIHLEGNIMPTGKS